MKVEGEPFVKHTASARCLCRSQSEIVHIQLGRRRTSRQSRPVGRVYDLHIVQASKSRRVQDAQVRKSSLKFADNFVETDFVLGQNLTIIDDYFFD